MNRTQENFIKDIDAKTVDEIVQFVKEGNITWDELVYHASGKFSMKKQRQARMILTQGIQMSQEEVVETDRFDNDSSTFELVGAPNVVIPIQDDSSLQNSKLEELQMHTNTQQADDSYDSEDNRPVVEKIETDSEEHGLFSYKGRMGRWNWFAILFAINALSGLFFSFFTSDASIIVFCVMIIPLTWIAICINSKRCHDIGWSGWCQLIPLIGILLLFWPGDDYDNKYGPAQK